jgi:hypothetical protein
MPTSISPCENATSYLRVSSLDQNEVRQLEGLAGRRPCGQTRCERIDKGRCCGGRDERYAIAGIERATRWSCIVQRNLRTCPICVCW